MITMYSYYDFLMMVTPQKSRYNAMSTYCVFQSLETSSPHLTCAKGKLDTFDIPGDKNHDDLVSLTKNKIRGA